MVAATLSVALASAGCGGDGSASGEGQAYDVVASTTMTVASPRLTKAQFVQRMNKLCREAWVTVNDNFKQHTGWQDREDSARDRFVEAVQVSLLAGIDFHIFDNFRILGSPPGEERQIEKMIGPFQASVELGQLGRWRAYSVEEIPPQFEEFNRRAARYGLDDCLVDEAHLRKIDQVAKASA